MCLRYFSFFTCLQIHLLGSDDRLLSHMASRSLASLVYFQLKKEVSVASLHSSKNELVSLCLQVVPFVQPSFSSVCIF